VEQTQPGSSSHAAGRRSGEEPFVRGVMMRRLLLSSLFGWLLSSVVSCAPLPESMRPEAVPITASVENPADVKYYPSDEPLRMGKEHFGRGNYGLAERYFRDAVEKAPKDPTAWIGLAASYDRLRRFDLADRAYAQAIRLTGETVQILNNEGYSYMLRGDLVRARRKLQRAYELDPTNPTITDNLQLLNGSHEFIERPPGQP
jgi:tetratricopeptide (TPR) repeat protein